jgi:arylsulfatase A-like enzyme
MPTLCGLAGAKVGSDLKWDGTDIWSVLTQPKQAQPVRTLYTAAPGFRAQAVRHGDWKLVVTVGNGKKAAAPQEELFDLSKDPGETKNLAGERADILKQMKERLAAISKADRDAIAND